MDADEEVRQNAKLLRLAHRRRRQRNWDVPPPTDALFWAPYLKSFPGRSAQELSDRWRAREAKQLIENSNWRQWIKNPQKFETLLNLLFDIKDADVYLCLGCGAINSGLEGEVEFDVNSAVEGSQGLLLFHNEECLRNNWKTVRRFVRWVTPN